MLKMLALTATAVYATPVLLSLNRAKAKKKERRERRRERRANKQNCKPLGVVSINA